MRIKIRCILNLLIVFVLIFSFNKTKAQELEKEIKFSEHKYIPFYNLKKAGNTTIFQGNKKKKEYFEGWYFKMVSNDGKSILSVIPGISLSEDGKEQHAFIQLINGITAKTYYFTFDIEDFSFSKKEFAIKIGDNYFSKNKIILNLKNSVNKINGEVDMLNLVNYKSGRLFNSAIMGWYRFVPFMECYHGVVSLTHNLKGKLTFNHETFNFNGGKGYIEKDWGSSMPSSWIWMQSNNFTDTNTSLMLSIANIPWMGNSFNGFLGFLYYNGEIYHFSSYRPTKLNLEITDSNELNIKIENRKNSIILYVKSNNSGLLKAPNKGSMDRRIAESIDANIKITIFNKKGNIIYTDSTNIAGLEMVGDYKSLKGILK